MGTPWIHGRDPLTSLVTLRKIDHPSYKCLEWKFRAEVLELTTNYWPIVQGCSGGGALGYRKVIANLFELDEMTWRHLILGVIANLFELDEMTWRHLMGSSPISSSWAR